LSIAIYGTFRSGKPIEKKAFELMPKAIRELSLRQRWFEIAVIVVTGSAALLYWLGLLALPLLYSAVALGLVPLASTAVRDLVRERKIGTELFISVATVIAMVGGEYVAGAVMLSIILIAELIADLNSERARASIKSLIGAIPQTALVRRDGREASIAIDDVKIGEIVIVRAGERIPVDGTIASGNASVNQAPITGESVPVEKRTDDQVFAGTVVDLGALDVRVDKRGKETLYARVIALVENAQASQAPVQKLTDRVAAWLIPVVLIFLVAVFVFTRDLKLIITLMIFTSPAELGLATPLVMIAAIARAAQSGILLKGGVVLEQLAKVDVVAVDKTGTITFGRPEVVRIELFTADVEEDELLRLGASLERRSSHPLAKAIIDRSTERGLSIVEPADFKVVAGRGVSGTVSGRRILAGNAAFVGAPPPSGNGDGMGSTVYIAADGRALGVIILADRIRPDAKSAIAHLKASGVERVIMLTGDNEATAQSVAAETGIDEVRANLLPEDKLRVIEALQHEGCTVAMIGDGINDAPALAQADVGIAMGVAGTQAALEAADVALMNDDIGKIAEARVLAARAYRTIQQNLIVGVGVVHLLGITAAILRYIGPVEAAMLHLGPDVLVFLNSVRLLRAKLDHPQ
jgi:Zn2+/Cd2+-exporting ATPase